MAGRGYVSSGSGSSGSKSSSKTTKKSGYTIPEVESQLRDIVKTTGAGYAKQAAADIRDSGISSGYVKGNQAELNRAMNDFIRDASYIIPAVGK